MSNLQGKVMPAKDVLVIGRSVHPDGKETAVMIESALKPYLAKRGLSSQLALFKDLLFDISNYSIKVLHMPAGDDVKDFRTVLMTNWFSHASVRKDIAHSLALYLEASGVPLLNSEALHSRSTSKLSQMMLAALNGVPIPRTVLCLSLDHLKDYLNDNNFKGPFIFKDAQASRGKGNFLLKDIGQIEDYRTEHSERHPFMAQQLVEAGGSDFRFFVAGGKARLVIKRTGLEGQHLNNVSTGAQTELVPLQEIDQAVMDMVESISRQLHREVTGIDIIFDKTNGRPYFLEANPIPQIASGSNVDAKLQALAEALQESVERRAK